MAGEERAQPPRLSAYVHVTDDAGLPFQFGPNDLVPEWAIRKITNPDVWVGEAPQVPEPEPGEVNPETAHGDGGVTSQAPPRSGRGSGLEAWTTFAQANNVDIADGATRDEVIAAVEAAGLVQPE